MGEMIIGTISLFLGLVLGMWLEAWRANRVREPIYQFPTPWQHFNVCPCGHNTKTTDLHYTFAWHPCPECGTVSWEKDVTARRWSDGRFERLPPRSDDATVGEEVTNGD